MSQDRRIRPDYISDRPHHRARPRRAWLLVGLALPTAALAITATLQQPRSDDITAQTLLQQSDAGNQTMKSVADDHTHGEAVPQRVSIQVTRPVTAIPRTAGSKTGATKNPNKTAASRIAANMAMAAEPAWETLQVQSGDSLSAMFTRIDLPASDWMALLDARGETRRLVQLRPGDELHIQRGSNGQLQRLKLPIDDTRTLIASRDAEGFVIDTHELPVETRTAHAHGVIHSSLFEAASDAGMSDRLTMELANIFGWDIDFALDIRSGDQFTVVYEEIWRNGDKLRDGNIVAAEFVNRGRSIRAVRFAPEGGNAGYYTPDGHAMRKAFIRTPLDFARVSSGFNLRRKHPVLNKIRAHRGVDYAASRGTPIRATGDGKIIHRGTKGGYGRAVVVRHGNKYTTLYAHLSRYRRGQGMGSRVRQGEVIGYVGSSGLATGPHLHYEFRVNGVHMNPLTVKLPRAQAIPGKYRKTFEAAASPLLAKLDVLSRTRVAVLDD